MVDATRKYVGVITAQAVAEALVEQPQTAPVRVGQLVEPPAPVTADQPLAEALHALLYPAGTGMPVLDAEHGEPVGRLSHQNALRAVHTPTA